MTNIILDAFYSLGKKINKAMGDDTAQETAEGVIGEKFPELKLNTPNEDLANLADKWQRVWESSPVYAAVMEKGSANEDYWLGKHTQQPRVDKIRPLVDNVIFEALETYLPQVTQHNPEPVVTLDSSVPQTPENLAYATHLKLKLAELADELKIRLKLKKAARHWAIYLLGAAKVGWDLDRDIPTAKIIRPKKLILDPEATVDEDGYTGNRIGEHRSLEAGILIQMLDAIGGEDGYKKLISDMVKDELGTQVGFIEWWTNEYLFWSLGKEILMKKKNPNWNYDTEEPMPQEEQDAAPMGEENNGMPLPQIPQQEAPAPEATKGDAPAEQQPAPTPTQTKKGFNHLASPKMPYLFLSVFNLGKQPVDDTSLIGQNLSSQDLINKRLRQIDKNADSMNGGMVVSLERSGLTQQQAKGVTEALRKGGTIAIPAGAVNEAIARMSAPGLPNDVYLQLTDTRSRVAYIFGTKGFTPSGGGSTASAVRSQIINQNLDQARISGGFSEYLEQFADDLYNWFIQLLYVYDDNYAGQDHPRVRLTVKEGSLLPKDTASIATQSKELVMAGKMSLVDFYKKIESPNPEELAANVWLEANAPEVLYGNDPRIQQVIKQKQDAAATAAQSEKKPPSESINFKDLPPEGKAQMAKQAGLDLHPEGIAAHDEVVHERSQAPAQPEPIKQPQQP